MHCRPAVLFVCLGNICRSPLAEAAFRTAAAKIRADIDADSAGTGAWHVGEPPDPRAVETAAANGLDISGYRARQVQRADFGRFNHILALDQSNLSTLKRMKPIGAGAELSLLLNHAPGRAGQEVADPYYGSADGFAVAWADVTAGAEGLLARLLPKT